MRRRPDEPGFVPFTPPATLADAETRRLDLVTSIQDIDAQLADRDRHDPATGQRLTAHAYWDWRRKALAAHRYKSAELRAVNGWIVQHHRATRVPARWRDAFQVLVDALLGGSDAQAAVQQARALVDGE